MKITKQSKFTLFIATLSTFALGGCASLFLEAARNSGPLKNTDLSNFQQMQDISTCMIDTKSCALTKTIELAFNQADAYATAARNTQAAQDRPTQSRGSRRHRGRIRGERCGLGRTRH